MNMLKYQSDRELNSDANSDDDCSDVDVIGDDKDYDWNSFYQFSNMFFY